MPRVYDEYSKEELKNILRNATSAIDEGLINHPFHMARLMFVLRSKTIEQESLGAVSSDRLNSQLLPIIEKTDENRDNWYSELDYFLEHGEIPEETENHLKILRLPEPKADPKKRKSRKAVAFEP